MYVHNEIADQLGYDAVRLVIDTQFFPLHYLNFILLFKKLLIQKWQADYQNISQHKSCFYFSFSTRKYPKLLNCIGTKKKCK